MVVIPNDFSEFAQLWQEQVDSLEQAEIRLLANDVVRKARRWRLFDILVFLGMTVVSLHLVLREETSLTTKVALAIAFGSGSWLTWKRLQVAKLADRIAACEPSAILPAAIRAAKAEADFYTISFWVGCPAATMLVVALMTQSDHNGLGWGLGNSIMVSSVIAAIVFLWIRSRAREKLRRLEAMNRELEEENMRDLVDYAPSERPH